MKKVLTIGSALVDIFVSSAQFQLDEAGTLTCGTANGKLDVESLIVKTGGGATNTAVGFSRLGYEVRLISELGSDEFAQLIESDLNREKVATKFLIRERREQTGGSVILVTHEGERLVLVHRGAASQLNPHDVSQDAFTDLDWVYMSSVSGQIETIQKIGYTMKQAGLSCTWNPGNKELEALAAGQLTVESLPVGIFLVNKEEWETIAALQADCLATFPLTVVTDGAAGGTVYQSGYEPRVYKAASVTAVDMTGAGDAFGVGFTHAMLQDQSVTVAAEWGVRNAASVVQQIGAKPGLLSSL